jgi:hypothetical protein
MIRFVTAKGTQGHRPAKGGRLAVIQRATEWEHAPMMPKELTIGTASRI